MYKVETHLHTSQASACGQNTGSEMIKACRDAGYDMVFVTDHFFNGNTNIDRSLPWEKKIKLFCRGYEDAARTGAKIGVEVRFGLEYNFRGAEFLFYEVTKEWLLSYPEIMNDHVHKVFSNVHKAGGYVIHVHPFRNASYLPSPPALYPEHIDAMEVLNMGNSPEDNEAALEYAEAHGLVKFAGSDVHSIRLRHGGMVFPEKVRNTAQMIEFAAAGKCRLLDGTRQGAGENS